ncbi:MAG: Archaeal histone A2 [Methanoregulaceae archaeon PtaB.Bin108]|jgi:histone H3/H4|nr:MAG: Archaeal histone A2 [Methanoregulaceae archaeon PtaB.Bin108]
MKMKGTPSPAKKRTKSSRSSPFDLPIAPVMRIAKNSGAERISMDGTKAIVARTEMYIASVARGAADAAASEGRKTIRAEDIQKY